MIIGRVDLALTVGLLVGFFLGHHYSSSWCLSGLAWFQREAPGLFPGAELLLRRLCTWRRLSSASSTVFTRLRWRTTGLELRLRSSLHYFSWTGCV